MKIFFDDCFEEEREYAKFPISSFRNIDNEVIILRHWMMDSNEYATIDKSVKQHNGQLYTSLEMYELAHKLPNWYPYFKDVTFKTEFVKNNDKDIQNWFATKPFANVFVKDDIKSLTTSTGSIAKSSDQFFKIIEEMRYYGVTGNFCFREFINILPETEQRHFIFDDTLISDSFDISEEILSLIKHFPARFFSFDTVYDISGKQWLVEVGDGQVSSTKMSIEQTKELYNLISS